jgi:hypothetical protein
MPAVSAASSRTLSPGPAGAGHRTRQCRFICAQCALVMNCACCSVLGPMGCRPVPALPAQSSEGMGLSSARAAADAKRDESAFFVE